MRIEEKIRKNKIKYLILMISMTIGIGIILLCNIQLGSMKIEGGDIIKVTIGKIFDRDDMLAEVAQNITAIIWEIRLPRIICGIFVGAGLATAGVIFQGILKNPLADPYTLGISTGASFGATIAIYINITLGIMIPITISALIMSFITLIAVIMIAKNENGIESSSLIIAGIIVSSILSSGISFIKMLAGENVGAIVFWLMGSLASKTWEEVYIIVPIVTIGISIAMIFSKELNIMTLGDENAYGLGVNSSKIRLIYLMLGATITAGCVAISGIIGFIGLIIPHLLRFRFSSDNRYLIPLSALTGGILLSVADNITRVMTTSEIPVGVLTTLIGGPFFIYVFMKRGKVKRI